MRVSKFLSIIIHPIFIPLVVFKTTLFVAPSINFAISSYTNFITLIFILTTLLLPVLVVFILIKKGQLTSLEITNHKERSKPLFYSFLIMFLGYCIVKPILVFAPIIKAELLSAIIIVLLASFISKYWKISLHMLGVGGGTGAFVGIHFLYGGVSNLIIVSLLISAVLAIARINEKAHNQTQIYIGFLLGFFIQFCSILLH